MRRGFRAIGLGLALGLATVATVPIAALGRSSSVQTAAAYRPDASIEAVKSRYYIEYDSKWISWTQYPGWKGVGVYNGSGDHQVAKSDTQNVGPEKHTLAISIKNNGSKADRYKLATFGGFTGDWTVRWFKGSTEITNGVEKGTYVTPIVQAGMSLTLTLKLSGDASLGYYGAVTTSATSVGDASKVDAVKVMMKQASWCYC